MDHWWPIVGYANFVSMQFHRKKIPKLSIAGGVDFGLPSRIGLETLTLAEEYLIAQARLLVSIVKLVGSQPTSRQSAKRGHIITFPHNGPTALAEHRRAHFETDEGIYPRVDGLSDVIFVLSLELTKSGNRIYSVAFLVVVISKSDQSSSFNGFMH